MPRFAPLTIATRVFVLSPTLDLLFVLRSSRHGTTHLFGVSPRWLTEEPRVLATELRCARVPHIVGDRLRARRSRQQEAASLPEPQPLLILDRAHRRHRLEVVVQRRRAHVDVLGERLDLQWLREVLLYPGDRSRDPP